MSIAVAVATLFIPVALCPLSLLYPGYLRRPTETRCPVLFDRELQQFLSPPETTDTFADIPLTHAKEKQLDSYNPARSLSLR